MRRILKNIYFTIEQCLLDLKDKKDILFVVENELMFKYVHLIHKNLLADKRLRMSFCFVHKDRSFSKTRMKLSMKGRTVPYWLARRIKWDLIIYPNHGPYFRADCPKIYIGHGLNSGKKLNGEEYLLGSRSLGENGQIIYEKIFRSSEFVRSQIKKYYPKFHSTVRVVGSLCADQLKDNSDGKEDRLVRLGLDKAKKTILFASSWGPDALLSSQGDCLVKQIPDLSKKYNVIISAHLNDYTQAHHQDGKLKELFQAVERHNVYMTKPTEGGHTVLPLADLLVTDMTALSLYFPPFRRPIIFYDVANMDLDPTSLILELRKEAYVITDFLTLKQDITKAFEDFDENKMEELTGKIFSFRGQAWERHKEEIYESLKITPYGEPTRSSRVLTENRLSSDKDCASTLMGK